jgi:hypothetical protein
MFGKEQQADPRRPACTMCGAKRIIVRVMRRAGEGDQQQDDPDYAIRVCETCDRPT